MTLTSTLFHRSVHLTESQLTSPDVYSICPFCESINRELVWILQKNPEVSLIRCNSCYAVSASRMPSKEALSAYYDVYYKSQDNTEKDTQVTFDNPDRLSKIIASFYAISAKSKLPNRVSILDFGGGDGIIAFLTAKNLLDRGIPQVSITVVDYGEKLHKTDDNRIELEKVPILENIDGLYSIVIASAVLEHLPSPSNVVKSLLEHMDPQDGIFYARTPFMLPIMRLLSRFGIIVDFTFPAHLHDLGQNFWETYFAKVSDKYKLVISRPSTVETSIEKHFLRTLIAYSLKAPWYLFRDKYSLVGGWEVFVKSNKN